MPAPINIYLESATHYAQDLNGETDAISRSAFERQLLECLIISGLKTDYKLSLLNEVSSASLALEISSPPPVYHLPSAPKN